MKKETLRENDDYIYKKDLAERLNLSKCAISRAADRAGLPKRHKNRRGKSERYFLIGEVLQIKDRLRKQPGLDKPPKRADNRFKSWQRISTW